MALGRSQSLTALATTLAVLFFVIISSVAVVWANGLRYNPASGKFEQTVLVAIDGDRQDINVSINGTEFSNQIPYRARNLLPDHYVVELSKPGFQTWRQSFWLSAGQVGVIDNPTLIATNPLVTTADTAITVGTLPAYDFGLQVNGGELIANGSFVTRFTNPPVQVHRFNDYYLYQKGNELHLFLPSGNQDHFIYSASLSTQLPLILYQSSWQIAVNDGGSVKLINLIIPGSN